MRGAVRRISRREFLVFGAGLGAIALALPFAMADDTGIGEEDGGDGTGAITSDYGNEFIWFDRGGFVDRKGLEPAQGWDTTSADYFWDLMCERMQSRGKSAPYSGIMAAFDDTNIHHYQLAAEAALKSARQRAGTEHARIVGVGWYWTSMNGTNWQFGAFSGGTTRTFTDLIPRAGNEDELPQSVKKKQADGESVELVTGWGDKATSKSDGTEYQTWRAMAYELNKGKSTGGHLNVVVIAVADDEPTACGYITIEKDLQF